MAPDDFQPKRLEPQHIIDTSHKTRTVSALNITEIDTARNEMLMQMQTAVPTTQRRMISSSSAPLFAPSYHHNNQLDEAAPSTIIGLPEINEGMINRSLEINHQEVINIPETNSLR